MNPSLDPASSHQNNQMSAADRRRHKRHDMEIQEIKVDRWDGARSGKMFGKIVDISAGGVRVRTNSINVQADNQIRVRLELPAYAGISPFVAADSTSMEPKNEWVGWMTVSRVIPVGSNQFDVAGQLVDMDEMDRGMLGLYLSTQPLAA